MQPNPALMARSARWTRWAVTAILIATLAFQVAVLVPGLSHVRLHAAGDTPIGQALNLAHSAFMLIALVQLILLLKLLEGGELFSVRVTRRLRGFALFTLLAVAAATLVAPLLTYLFPQCADGMPCRRRFPIDMRGLWAVVTSIVFFLVARVLDEARRIDEDNRQII